MPTCGNRALCTAALVGTGMALGGIITLATSALKMRVSVSLLTVGSIISAVALTILCLPKKKEEKKECEELIYLRAAYKELQRVKDAKILELTQKVRLLTKEKAVQEVICARMRLTRQS